MNFMAPCQSASDNDQIYCKTATVGSFGKLYQTHFLIVSHKIFLVGLFCAPGLLHLGATASAFLPPPVMPLLAKLDSFGKQLVLPTFCEKFYQVVINY